MENVEYLFNSEGNWIAFKIGIYLFNTQISWIGWFPWEDKHAVTIDGNYLGSIFDQQRFYQMRYFTYRGAVCQPISPGYPGAPQIPPFLGYDPLPSGVNDFSKEKLNYL